MKNKYVSLAIVLTLFSFPILAQVKPTETFKEEPAAAAPAEAEIPEGSVTFDNQFVTNYVFRGDDVLKNYWAQRGQQYGSFGRAGAYQPSITYNTPIAGLTFNIWGSLALTRRNDRETDNALQTGPGGTDLISSNCDALGRTCPSAATIGGAIVSPAGNQIATTGYAANINTATGDLRLPGFYKEQNGLKRVDEMDLILDYTTLTKGGKLIFGLIHYSLLNPVAKAVPFTNGGATYYQTEIYAGYALTKLPDLIFKVNSDVVHSHQYWTLAYSKEKTLTTTLALVLGVSAGYQVRQNIQGWQDVTGKIGVKAGGFTAGFNFAYRPDLKMMEAIMNEDLNTKLPMWIEGSSTMYDGYVRDPSKITFTDRMVNRALTQYGSTVGLGTYAYQPRQKLPHTLVWFNIGYSLTF